MSAATKEIMSSTRKGELNPLYGKSRHSREASKELMRQKAGVPLGRKYSEETKLLMRPSAKTWKSCEYIRKVYIRRI